MGEKEPPEPHKPEESAVPSELGTSRPCDHQSGLDEPMGAASPSPLFPPKIMSQCILPIDELCTLHMVPYRIYFSVFQCSTYALSLP